MDNSLADLFAGFAESVPLTPLLRKLPGPPLWAEKTRREPVEPLHTMYQQLSAILNDLQADTDDGLYELSQEHIRLIQLQHEMLMRAFRNVPNPDYDDARATEYWDKRKTVTWSQQYWPTEESK